jgi:hypothetical protein
MRRVGFYMLDGFARRQAMRFGPQQKRHYILLTVFPRHHPVSFSFVAGW